MASTTRKLCVLLIGAPGSGKGTVLGRILKNFNMKHFSAGDHLRQLVRNQTEIGKQIADKLKAGDLLPAELTNSLILPQLKAIRSDYVLLDGYPRETAQVTAFHAENAAVLKMHSVIYLKVPFDVIANRLKSRWMHLPSGRAYNVDFNPPQVWGRDDVTGEALVQRDDDKPETVLKRLGIFQQETTPVLEFYRKIGLLTEFAGETTDQIWPHILNHLRTIIPDKHHLIINKNLTF